MGLSCANSVSYQGDRGVLGGKGVAAESSAGGVEEEVAGAGRVAADSDQVGLIRSPMPASPRLLSGCVDGVRPRAGTVGELALTHSPLPPKVPPALVLLGVLGARAPSWLQRRFVWPGSTERRQPEGARSDRSR